MTPRRALTLLEVLIASAVLVLLAIALVPLLQKALTDLTEPSAPTIAFDELCDAADKCIADSGRFGIPDVDDLTKLGEATIAWPSYAENDPENGSTPKFEARPSINIRYLAAADSKVNHVWLIFECEDQSVARWIAFPKEPTQP